MKTILLVLGGLFVLRAVTHKPCDCGCEGDCGGNVTIVDTRPAVHF